MKDKELILYRYRRSHRHPHAGGGPLDAVLVETPWAGTTLIFTVGTVEKMTVVLTEETKALGIACRMSGIPSAHYGKCAVWFQSVAETDGKKGVGVVDGRIPVGIANRLRNEGVLPIDVVDR